MSDKITLDACFSPYLYPIYRNDENIVVIIDILRATSAICTAFEHGAEKKLFPLQLLKKRGFGKPKVILQVLKEMLFPLKVLILVIPLSAIWEMP